jgi:hypothetical protein
MVSIEGAGILLRMPMRTWDSPSFAKGMWDQGGGESVTSTCLPRSIVEQGMWSLFAAWIR